jgi:hypothetical protein
MWCGLKWIRIESTVFFIVSGVESYNSTKTSTPLQNDKTVFQPTAQYSHLPRVNIRCFAHRNGREKKEEPLLQRLRRREGCKPIKHVFVTYLLVVFRKHLWSGNNVKMWQGYTLGQHAIKSWTRRDVVTPGHVLWRFTGSCCLIPQNR